MAVKSPEEAEEVLEIYKGELVISLRNTLIPSILNFSEF